MTSQNSMADFFVYGVFLGVFGYLAYKELRALWAKGKFEYEYLKHPRLMEYNEFRACVEVHKWHPTSLALRGLDVGAYMVCLDCGTISGREDVMCSDAVLNQLKESIEIETKTAAVKRMANERIAMLTEGYVDLYIKRNFEAEVNDVHLAERLRNLSRYTITAMAQAAEKVHDEVKGQTDLDSMYEDWPHKHKGNA